MSSLDQSTPRLEILAQHVVRAGETLSAIALHYYGSAAHEKWMAIYNTNRDTIGPNYSLIRPGQKLQIPKLTSETPSNNYIAEYEVKPGDSLSQIALWHYGTARRDQWVKIYKANSKLIGDNPYHLQAGQILKIPDPRDGTWIMRSDRPMPLTITNNGALPCNIFWVNHEGKEVYRAYLDIGQTTTQDAFESHEWIVRDSKSGRLIAATVVTPAQPTFAFDTDHLSSPHSLGEKISIIVWNYTSLSVDLYQVEPEGQETLLNTYEPDDNGGLVDTSVNAVLRVREHETQSEVNLFVVSADRRREYNVESPFLAGHPRTTLNVYNDTGFTVDAYRKVTDRDGQIQEKHHQTIAPYDYWYKDTYATHEWIFREQRSGNKLGTVTALPATTTLHISVENLRSAGGNQPITHLSLKNDTFLWLDIYKVDSNGVRHAIALDILPNSVYVFNPGDSGLALFEGDVILVNERASGCAAGAYILAAGQNDFDLALKTIFTQSNGIIEFYNAAPLEAEILYWMETGQQKQVATIQPGQRVFFPTDGSTPWMAFLNGLPLGLWFGREGEQSCMISTNHLRSLPSTIPSHVTIFNDTHYRIEVHRVDINGTIGLMEAAEPHASLPIETTLATALIVRDADSGADLTIFAANAAEQSFYLAEHLIVEGEREGGVLFAGEVALYSEPDFKGNVWIVRTDFANLAAIKLGTLNDTVASIKVGSGTGITLYENPNYDGKAEDYFVNISKLSDLENKTSSFKVWTYTGKGSTGIHATTSIWTRNLKLDLNYKYICGEDSIPLEFQDGNGIPAISFLADTVVYFRERLKRVPVDWSNLEQVRQLLHDVINWEQPQSFEWESDPNVLKFIAYWWRIRTTNLDRFSMGMELAKQVASRVKQDMPFSEREEKQLAGELEETCNRILEVAPTDILTTPAYHFESSEKFYRCIINFPSEVEQVEITSLGDTKISLGGAFAPISATSPIAIKPTAGRLIILLQADTVGKPVLRLKTNTMAENEAYLVYPDSEIYRNFRNSEPNTLWKSRQELGINSNLDEATCKVVEQTLKNLSSCIAYADPAGQNMGGARMIQVDGRTMDYPRWITRFGTDSRFQPLSHEDYAQMAMAPNVKQIDLTSAQGWDDFVEFFEDVGDTIVNAGEALVSSVEWVAVRIYDNIIVPTTNVAIAVIDRAVSYGQAAVNIVAKFGEKALDYIEKLGKTGFDTLMTLGEAGWDALMALPTEGLEALAKFGTTALDTLVNAGVDVVNFTAQLGKEGLGALKELGELGIQLALEIKQGADNAGQFMVEMLNGIHPELGKALEMTFSVGGEIIKFVANVGKQIGKVVTLVINKIGVLAGEFIGWIASAFGWDDVMKTQQTLIKFVNDGLSRAIDFIPDALDQVLVKPWPKVKAQLKALMDQTGIQAHKPAGLSNLVETTKSNMFDMSEFQGLLSQIVNAIGGTSLDIDLDDLFDEEANQALDELKTLAEDEALSIFMTALEQPFQHLEAAKLAMQDPAEIPQLLLSELLGPMRAQLEMLLDLMEKMLPLLVKLMKSMLRAVQRLINAELDMPGLSGLIEGLTDQKPTSLNLATLLLAIPTTISLGPVTGLPSVASSEISMDQTLASINASTKIVFGITGPIGDFTEESKVGFGILNIVLGIIGQFTSLPNIVRKNWGDSKINAEKLNLDSNDFSNKAFRESLSVLIWYVQWFLVALGIIATVISSWKKKGGWVDFFNYLSAAENCFVGVAQLVISSLIIDVLRKNNDKDDKDEDAANIIGCVPSIVSPATVVESGPVKVFGWAVTAVASFAEGGIRMHLAQEPNQD